MYSIDLSLAVFLAIAIGGIAFMAGSSVSKALDDAPDQPSWDPDVAAFVQELKVEPLRADRIYHAARAAAEFLDERGHLRGPVTADDVAIVDLAVHGDLNIVQLVQVIVTAWDLMSPGRATFSPAKGGKVHVNGLAVDMIAGLAVSDITEVAIDHSHLWLVVGGNGTRVKAGSSEFQTGSVDPAELAKPSPVVIGVDPAKPGADRTVEVPIKTDGDLVREAREDSDARARKAREQIRLVDEEAETVVTLHDPVTGEEKPLPDNFPDGDPPAA